MLAALLANLNKPNPNDNLIRGGDDAPRNRHHRRGHYKIIKDDQEEKRLLALAEYNAENDLQIELQAGYALLSESTSNAEDIVKPFDIGTSLPRIDWLALVRDVEQSRLLLSLYHDSMDEELLLLVD